MTEVSPTRLGARRLANVLLALAIGMISISSQFAVSSAEAGSRVLHADEQAAISVTNLNDAGPGSLRQAIADANASPGADAINITVTGTIGLQSPLPVVLDSVNIAGPRADQLEIRRVATVPFRILEFAAGQTSTLSGVRITNGNAASGGGIYNSGTLTITECTVADNTASVSGGGITNTGTLTLVRSTVATNSAQQDNSGGGIDNNSVLIVRTSTISSNKTAELPGTGAGIRTFGGSVDIISSTITVNVNRLGSSTITTRPPESASGIKATGGAVVSLRNTIVGGNGFANVIPDLEVDTSSSIVSAGHNLISNRGDVASFLPTDQTGTMTARRFVDLSQLEYDGGPTMVHRPNPSSPAVDKGSRAGSADAVDQRNQPRTVDFPATANAAGGDGTDIGAYEAQQVRFLITRNSGPIIQGEPFTFTVRAVPSLNFQAVTSFRGTIGFTSSAPATLPASYTFTEADAGEHTFTATLTTIGSQTITAASGGAEPAVGTGSFYVYPAETVTTVVTNTNDSGPGSLRQAIADAGLRGTVTFSPEFSSGSPKLIALTSGPIIVGSVTIAGPGANRLTVSGNNSSRVFEVWPTAFPANISGITVSGGAPPADTFPRGGAFNAPYGGTMNLNSVVVTGTLANSAIYMFAGRVTISNSTLYANSSTAVFSDEGELTVTNSTISGNLGTGISAIGRLRIFNSTITNNAYGVSASSFYLTIGSSIIADNLSNSTRPDIDIYGVSTPNPDIVSAGYNLIGNRGTASFFNGPGDQAGTAANIFGAQLLPLQNNGGPAPTHLPRPGSRAVDAGNSFGLAADQRGAGFARTVDLARPNAPGGDGTDIGATELQTEPPTANETISGKLRRPGGQALANTRVYAIDDQGRVRATSTTSSFGEFALTGLPVGYTYQLRVESKRYRFALLNFFLDRGIYDLNFVGLE